MDKQVRVMNLLDATYEVDAESIDWLFPNNQGESFIVKGVALRGASDAYET